MGKETNKKFSWVIENFSSLQSECIYSDPVLFSDCKWRLFANPKGNACKCLPLYLQVIDIESLPRGWRRYVKLRLTIVSTLSCIPSVRQEADFCFDVKFPSWGFPKMIPLLNLHAKNGGFIENGRVMIFADFDVFETVGTFDASEKSEEASKNLSEIRQNDCAESIDLPTKTLQVKESNVPLSKTNLDDGAKSSDLLNNTLQVKETIDVNGFQVLPSQVEYVSRIFERHPDIAVEFRAKNQHLRKACINFLLSLIETLCQSLEELSNEDLVEADIALTYVKDAGFKVDWLEKKLEEVKEKKEKERSGLAQLQEMEDNLLKLKQKCSDLDALVEKEKAELSVTRAPLSFDDVV